MATKNPDSASRLGGVLISNQVVAELLEQLRNGIWQDTDHLPPELELANRLNVSRTVVRDALSELERAGYIERVRHWHRDQPRCGQPGPPHGPEV